MNIKIYIINESGNKIMLTVSVYDKTFIMINAYCSKYRIDMNTCGFFYRAVQLKGNETFISLGVYNESSIYFYSNMN